LDEARSTFLTDFQRLPDPIKAISHPATYPVELSAELTAAREKIESEIARG
jgi:hypothetical protein